jgi:hypothetical protein
MIAEALAAIGGVPAKVLADRMGCLKGGVVANVVVPTADHVRFATHYGFRPDCCHAGDPESKRIVEHLCGYAQSDLVVPLLTEAAVSGVPVRVPAPTRLPRRGMPRSTPRCTRRLPRFLTSGWRPSGGCWRRCRRCDPRLALRRRSARSTGVRASGMARPVIRCLPG